MDGPYPILEKILNHQRKNKTNLPKEPFFLKLVYPLLPPVFDKREGENSQNLEIKKEDPP